MTVKSRNDVKSVCFWHVLCDISAFFEDIDFKFCTHIHETLSSNICYVFYFDLGETVLKKNWTFVLIFFLEIFKILKIRDNSFVALLLLRHLI